MSELDFLFVGCIIAAWAIGFAVAWFLRGQPVHCHIELHMPADEEEVEWWQR